MKDLDVFIQGETMNLCIPTEEFARESKWYSWFNRPDITRFLVDRGMFTNTQEDQVDFYCTQKSKRLMLIISNKKDYMGTISLSEIDLVKKICAVAIVVDIFIDNRMSPFISLEAMARMTEYAFNVIGFNRIEAAQHVKLKGWQQRMELLGYKIEGMHKNKFIKGHEIADLVSLACIYDDFKNIVSHRGSLWDSMEKMKLRFEKLPENSFANIMRKFYKKERDEYYTQLFLL